MLGGGVFSESLDTYLMPVTAQLGSEMLMALGLRRGSCVSHAVASLKRKIMLHIME